MGMDAGTAESVSCIQICCRDARNRAGRDHIGRRAPSPFFRFSFLKYHIGYDWSQLPAGSKIVDVGGGIGHVSLTIAKHYPHLRVVNQDLSQPIEISKAVRY